MACGSFFLLLLLLLLAAAAAAFRYHHYGHGLPIRGQDRQLELPMETIRMKHKQRRYKASKRRNPGKTMLACLIVLTRDYVKAVATRMQTHSRIRTSLYAFQCGLRRL